MRVKIEIPTCLALLLALPLHAGGTPPFPTAHEAALDATEKPESEEAGFRRLRAEFNGIEADRVPAYLYLPKREEGRRPAVLLQYGSGGSKGTDYIVELGRQFADHGFVVLTIDSPGRGERTKTDRKVSDWLFGDKGKEDFLHYCGDYSRAVDYLVSRDDVDYERIAFVGISWGAITGVTFVAHDDRVKAMASICGGGGFLDLAGLLGGKSKDSVDPVKHVAAIAPRPLLLINGKQDIMIPYPFAKALHNAAGKGAKKVWLDTNHYFEGVDRRDLGKSVIDFIDEAFGTL